MDFEAYLAFTKEKAKDLQRIAGKTQGDMSAEDLASEALLVAAHHAGKRGIPIDWCDPLDQKLILGTLTVQHVRRRNTERRCNVSADKEHSDHEEGVWTLLEHLHADETSDPLTLLERQEEEVNEREQREAEEAILETYSQSVAYNIVLWHFNNIRIRTAAYLAIARGTLRNRIASAASSLKVQPSLFDRIEKLDDTFMPEPGVQYAIRPEPRYKSIQWGWEF